MSAIKMNRRQFMQRSALTIGAAAFPAIVPSRVLGKDAPSNNITIGHIGVGSRGTDLINGFRGIPDCRVIAVSDCFNSRRDIAVKATDAVYGGAGCKSYADFRELCADPRIDAVVVATPDHWHVLAALEAVRNGKHVYVEKPLGISIESDKALRNAVQRYGVVFQYGTQQRSMDHMRWACEMVINGRLGKLKAVEIVCPGNSEGGSTTPALVPEDLDYNRLLGPAPWSPYTVDRCTSSGSYFISDFALGFVGGWGAHPLDIMLWALGDTRDAVPVEYEGTAVFPRAGLFDSPLSWDVRGRFADGKLFSFTASGSDLTTFIGEKGKIAVGRGGFGDIYPASLRYEKLRPGEKRLTASSNHGGNFIDAIKGGTRAVTTVESACYSDFISHLSDIAMRTGRKIHWDHISETIVGDPAAARMIHRPYYNGWQKLDTKLSKNKLD